MQNYPFIAGANRTTLPEHYCSCLIKTTANSYRYGRSTIPQAICQSSVFNRRGLKGPGAVSCKYTEEYFENLPYSVLLNYAKAKGLIHDDEEPDQDELIDIIVDFFESEQKIVSSPRQRRSKFQYDTESNKYF